MIYFKLVAGNCPSMSKEKKVDTYAEKNSGSRFIIQIGQNPYLKKRENFLMNVILFGLMSYIKVNMQ